VPGVTVRLYDAQGTLLDEMLTDGSGLYLFDQLIPGTYQVEFVLPTGYAFTLQDQDDGNPNADFRDSDADTTTGRTILIGLSSGEVDLTWDAGLYRLAPSVTMSGRT